MSPVSIHVSRDKPGLEVGSGGTRATVGIHGGGLCMAIEDGCYANARKRWEAGLDDDTRESAIERERAVVWYYTSIVMKADPLDKEDSLKQFADALNQLCLYGWEVVEQQFENHMALTKGDTMMWAELRKMKTSAEQAM